MERKIVDGDYLPDGAGGLCTLSGAEEVLGRVLFRLRARRGALPFRPELGSRLHLILRERPSVRQALAAQYVAQALAEETDLKIVGVAWDEGADGATVTVRLEWQGEALSARVAL